MQQALCKACDAAGDYFSEIIRQAEPAEPENQAANMAEYGAVYLKVDLDPWREKARKIIDDLVRKGELSHAVRDVVQECNPV